MVLIGLPGCTKIQRSQPTAHVTAEAAFFEQRYNDVILALTAKTQDLSPKSQYYLALSYINLQDKAHYINAVDLLTQSANASYPDAAWELARIYEDGVIQPVNTLKALDGYRLYARLNRSNKTPPPLYFDHNEKATSPKEMLQQLKQLANKGDVDTQIQLAKMYAEGINTEVNLKQSFYWYQKAARLGSQHGALMTGYYYCRGLGSQKSPQKANHWLKLHTPNLTCK